MMDNSTERIEIIHIAVKAQPKDMRLSLFNILNRINIKTTEEHISMRIMSPIIITVMLSKMTETLA